LKRKEGRRGQDKMMGKLKRNTKYSFGNLTRITYCRGLDLGERTWWIWM